MNNGQLGKVKYDWKPANDFVLIRPIKPGTTDGGIVLPDNQQLATVHGSVVGVGPGVMKDDGEYVPIDMKPGDRVIFEPAVTKVVEINGEHLVVVAAAHLLMHAAK